MMVFRSALVFRLLLCMASAALATPLAYSGASRSAIAGILVAVCLAAGGVRAIIVSRGSDPPVQKAMKARA